jgi:hypothetical protein
MSSCGGPQSVDGPHVGPHPKVDPNLTQQVPNIIQETNLVWVRWALQLSTGAQGVAVKNPCSTGCVYVLHRLSKTTARSRLAVDPIRRWASRWTTRKGGSTSDARNRKKQNKKQTSDGCGRAFGFLHGPSGPCSENTLASHLHWYGCAGPFSFIHGAQGLLHVLQEFAADMMMHHFCFLLGAKGIHIRYTFEQYKYVVGPHSGSSYSYYKYECLP